ncbi:hypothetical protein [Bosea sp. AAP35]|uniref:hypothetical protein n=1 Tax=Bosea sp. AAP35 TaxID=1523417 RepID=UPI0020BEF180|nr:hypothetical protein [Bosea sp. AAP35]
MMPALDLGQIVADSPQKIVVGIKDMARQIELDHGLRLADRSDLAFQIGHGLPTGGDVGRELDDLHRLAGAIQDWCVIRQQPDPTAALGHAQARDLDRLAPVQPRPEFDIVFRSTISFFDEKTMVFSDHFVARVPYGIEEIIVRVEDDTIQIEFYDRLGSPNGSSFSSVA